jgi:predicted amidohydrolase
MKGTRLVQSRADRFGKKSVILIVLFVITTILQIEVVTLAMTEPNQRRSAKIATVQLWVGENAQKADNLANALRMIDSAAAQNPDIIVLPENVLAAGTKLHYRDVSEQIPGPVTDIVSTRARRYNCYIVFPIIEKSGDKIFNSAVLFGRRGEILGVYHKVHEPEVIIKEEEVSLGDQFPVFNLDFGKVGIMICWDNTFVETASILALKGAEIIFFPHLIALPSQLNFNVTTRARAVDNCVFIVTAGIRTASKEWTWVDEGLSGTCMIGPDGKVLCQTDKNESQVIFQEIDLSKPRMVRNLGVWGDVNWKQQYLKERRPELYKVVVQPQKFR